MTSALKNREIYDKDPSTYKLVNEGVASVNDEATPEGLAVLRYELQTFVCDGQYSAGLDHILETYLKNIGEAQQPAVWVSGFYGSGKSHMVKMLRALWLDTPFPDGATARSVADLPPSIRDLLKELSTQGKRHGGLHAASGTLGAGASGSVRLALLRIIFRSAGLPGQYPIAKFVLWLKSEGIFDKIRKSVESDGYDWQEELDNFYVAEGLHKALVAEEKTPFSSPAACLQTLNNLYPYVQDVSNDEMVKAIRQALTVGGKFPLTLVVLDEVQQYIGSDPDRSNLVQECVEACCKNIGGKLIFIGTGQTAVTGTANLKKLEGRFTIRVELSDTDVDAVVRKVILLKKPAALLSIDREMQTDLGEISRHLSGTSIGHRDSDSVFFARDYAILPVRRRFWEIALRVLDQTGTDSQLRNQLSTVHKAIQTNLDAELGNVIPADYLYFDSADKLLQNRILPRKVHEKTMTWRNGNVEERLVARACGLVFLISRITAHNKEVGIRADVHTLADLLVEDLGAGSNQLRTSLPELLDRCELLMRVGDEYRIQTEESAAWNDEFFSQRNQLANEAHRIDAERDDRLRRRFSDMVSKRAVVQGQSKVPRDVHLLFEASLRSDAREKVYAWVRDGWSIDENSVRAEARQAGSTSPTIFVFIPRRSADDLRNHLIDLKAAAATLEKRGTPDSPEGKEARAAMETTRQAAESKVRELLDEALSGARVFQGGGTEIMGNDLQSMILEAAEKSLQRLYPSFAVGDHDGWGKVYANAKKGAPDALKSAGFEGDPAQNPVCKAVLAAIGPGKKGSDLRAHFDAPPYGWSRDAVDGALQVLASAGLLRVQDERGAPLDPRDLERSAIGKATLKVESATVSTPQRIQIRKVLQQIGVQARQGEELAAMPGFLQKAAQLAERAGGNAPKPERPDASALEDVRLAAGNEQLLAVYNRRDELRQDLTTWEAQGRRIEDRWPTWDRLQSLLHHADSLPEVEAHRIQAKSIADGRLLLNEPDLVAPMLLALTQLLRDELNRLGDRYDDEYESGTQALLADGNWHKLEPEQQDELLARHEVAPVHRPKIKVGSEPEILLTLNATSLTALRDRVAALPSRFVRVQQDAARLTEPQVTFVPLPRRTLKTPDEIRDWLAEVEQQLIEALGQGPVSIK